jgi:hypothetical protein
VFRRARIGEPTRHPAVGATLHFDRPATGPIVLGRLAHFGLGRFEPVPNFEKLAFSEHALEQMTERDFTQDDVETSWRSNKTGSGKARLRPFLGLRFER